MTAEAPVGGTRSTVRLHRNGATADIPVPFRPEDNINLSSLWPGYMIMIHYAHQKICAYQNGTGAEEVIIDNSPKPVKLNGK